MLYFAKLRRQYSGKEGKICRVGMDNMTFKHKDMYIEKGNDGVIIKTQ